MKYLAILTLVAMGLSLGACAHKQESSTSTMHSTSSTGYSK